MLKCYLKFKLINPEVVIVKRFQVLLEGNYLPAFDLKIFEHVHASPLLEAVERKLLTGAEDATISILRPMLSSAFLS